MSGVHWLKLDDYEARVIALNRALNEHQVSGTVMDDVRALMLDQAF